MCLPGLVVAVSICLQLFFSIPEDTLRELIPVLLSMPQDNLNDQLQLLANESPATIDLVYLAQTVSTPGCFLSGECMALTVHFELIRICFLPP